MRGQLSVHLTLYSLQPPSSQPPSAAASSKPTVPAKRKCASNQKKSAEFVYNEDEDLGLR